jgi:hypothetical protein
VIRHSWSDKYRTEYKSERRCWRCGLLETTHHEPAEPFPWKTYSRDGVKVESDGRVPVCEPVEVAA